MQPKPDTVVGAGEPTATILSSFEKTVARFSDKVAVHYPGLSGGPLTYKQLDNLSNAIAQQLAKRGSGPESRVLVLLPANEWFVALVLAIVKTGAAYVIIDPELPLRQQQAVIRSCKPCLIVTDMVQELGAPQITPAALVGDHPDATVRSGTDNQRSATSSTYLCYTSGTTGEPKAAVVPDRAVLNLAHQDGPLRVLHTDVVLQASAPSFDAFTFELWSSLLNGASLIGVHRDIVLDPTALNAFVQQNQVSTVCLTTSLFSATAFASPETIGRLRLAVFGGEAANVDAVRTALMAGPKILINGYGPTEATTFSLIQVVTYVPDDAVDIPIGSPIGGCLIRVLDEEGREVPDGRQGELWIGGRGLGSGYFENAALDAARFAQDPRNQFGRMYRTGDIVYRSDDGSIRYVGRIDNQVKIRGHRFELEDLESRIGADEAVRECVVVKEQSGADALLIAYVVAKTRSTGSQAVQDWTTVYNELYDVALPEHESSAFHGWNSALTNTPFPLEEMRLWRDSTVELIRSHNPNKVLEIGIGSGLLATELAAECEEYWGTDISVKAVENLRRFSALRPSHRLKLFHQEATDLSGMPQDFFDTIILNSVVQYFPGENYMREVLDGVNHLLRPGGYIFIGDVKNLDTFGEYAENVVDARRLKEELWLSPDYFSHLVATKAEWESHSSHVKRGRHVNELVSHRFDVMLRKTLPSNAADLRNLGKRTVLRWGGESLAELALKMSDYPHLEFRWNALPDSRHRPTHAGFEVEDLFELGDSCRRLTTVSPRGSSSVDLILSPVDADIDTWKAVDAGTGSLRPRVDLFREPVSQPSTRSAGRAILERLRASLPTYMVPSRLFVVPNLPMNVNGKIARGQLPDWHHLDDSIVNSEPSDAVTIVVRDLFAEVLSRHPSDVGTTTNFFDHGGHSLLAARLTTRLKAVFGHEISIADLYKHSTPEMIARQMQPDAGVLPPEVTGGGGLSEGRGIHFSVPLDIERSGTELAISLGSTQHMVIESALVLAAAATKRSMAFQVEITHRERSGEHASAHLSPHGFEFETTWSRTFRTHVSSYTQARIDYLLDLDSVAMAGNAVRVIVGATETGGTQAIAQFSRNANGTHLLETFDLGEEAPSTVAERARQILTRGLQRPDEALLPRFTNNSR